MDDDGHAEFTGESPQSEEERRDVGERAIQSCPELALSWADVADGS
jgi:ferredoxin